MIDSACRRADDLNTPGLVVKFELLPPHAIESSSKAGLQRRRFDV